MLVYRRLIWVAALHKRCFPGTCGYWEWDIVLLLNLGRRAVSNAVVILIVFIHHITVSNTVK